MDKEQNYSIEPESVNWKLPYMLKCNEYSNKKILVLHSYECAYMASINNSVIYVTDDEKKFKLFKKKVVNSIHFGSDDNAYLIKTSQWKDFKNVLDYICKEENMPKFDVAIMNPPYDGNLHLKILEKVIPVANKVVNISPIRWLQDPLAKYKKCTDFQKYENSISKKIEDLTIISTEKSNELFNINLLQPLGIYVIGHGGYDYNFSNSLLDKIYKKIILDKNFEKQNCVKYNKNLKNFVLTNIMAPPMKYGKPMFDTLKTWCGYFINGKNSKNETYDVAKHNCKASVRGDIYNDNAIVFDTANETMNCYNSFTTTFSKFCCMKSVVDVHVHQKFLPWMTDYNKPWTNKRFCEYFGITGYISDTKAEPNSEWETILNTMKEYE